MKKMLMLLISAGVALNSYSMGFMSQEWSDALCDQWNENEVLVTELGDKFVNNDGGRSYKMLIIARKDCPNSPDVQITLQGEDGMAFCVDSGYVSQDVNFKYDYRMSAETKHWIEMGNGDYGPMAAMLKGKLKFQGPKMEAMGFMKPFTQFLLLTGSVDSDRSVCP